MDVLVAGERGEGDAAAGGDRLSRPVELARGRDRARCLEPRLVDDQRPLERDEDEGQEPRAHDEDRVTGQDHRVVGELPVLLVGDDRVEDVGDDAATLLQEGEDEG